MDGIVKAHMNEYGELPALVVEVPQVTTILGAFAEYCQGFSIMATNDHGLRIAISPRSDNAVRAFNASAGNERKKFQLTAIRQRKEDKWGQVVKGVCQSLIASGISISGFDMTFKGQSAFSDEIALSAALTSGLVQAIDRAFHLDCGKKELISFAYGANRFSEIYNSRLRDIITIFTAERGKVIFFDTESYDYQYYDYPFTKDKGIGCYFIDCALPPDELAEEVSYFRSVCQEASEASKKLIPKGEKLRSFTERDVRRIHMPLSQELRTAVAFIVEESGFAQKAIDAIRTINGNAFGRLISAEQRNLSELAGITSPEVDWLVKRGAEVPGVRGVTEISCGITGTLIVLIDKGAEDRYFERIEEYERIFGFRPLIREFIPAGSIKVIYPDDYSSIE